MTAIERWREQLESWAIPAEILAAAPESPYGFPDGALPDEGRADATRAEPTPTTLRALERLPEGGRVLDVGCGGGATSLPLAGRAGVLVGVDAQEDMLEGFLANARAAGVDAEAVHGRWPDVAERDRPGGRRGRRARALQRGRPRAVRRGARGRRAATASSSSSPSDIRWPG